MPRPIWCLHLTSIMTIDFNLSNERKKIRYIKPNLSNGKKKMYILNFIYRSEEKE